MSPVVSEIERITKPVAGLELPHDLQKIVIKPLMLTGINVREPDLAAVSELKHMQMRKIPTRERDIDRLSQLRERMRRTDDQDPAWRGHTLDTPTALELNLNL